MKKIAGKEYLLQSSIVDLECNECGGYSGVRAFIASESTKAGRARNLVGINRNGIVPNTLTLLVNALETET